jgi:hypothetical protein
LQQYRSRGSVTQLADNSEWDVHWAEHVWGQPL